MKSVEKEQESRMRVQQMVKTFNSKSDEIDDADDAKDRIEYKLEDEQGGKVNPAFDAGEEGLEMNTVEVVKRNRTKSILDLEKPGMWDQFSVLLR